jgi:purine-binding chemotaxis protein CheW
MTGTIPGQDRVLVVEVKERFCALPLGQVIETMRPLPVETLAGLPPFVTGVATIRGIPTPVVDLGAILGVSDDSTGQRFVTVRAADRQVALLVSTIIGIRDLDMLTAIQDLPPLLQEASRDIVEKIGTLDERFLMVLQAGWRLPDAVWQAMRAQEAVS